MRVKAPAKLVEKRSWFSKFLLKLVGFNSDHLNQLLISILIIVLSVFVFRAGFFLRVESIFLDLLFKWRPAISVADRILYVELDERSLQAIKDRPWPRRYHGAMLEMLKKWGARVVFFDTIFESSSSNTFDDQVMEESLKKNKGVYFPVFVQYEGSQKILLHSISEFEKYAKGKGHININPDDDGIVRRFNPFIEVGGILYPHVGLKLAYDLLGRPLQTPQDLRSPPAEDGTLLISWPPKDSFKHYSYIDVLKSYELISKGKRAFVEPSDFKDKICLIGQTAAGGTDMRATPLDKSFPRLGIIGSIINGGLLGEFIQPATRNQNLICLIVLGLISIPFFLPFRNLPALLATCFLIVGWWGIVYFMFVMRGFWLFVFQPTHLILSLYVFSALFSKISSDRERLEFYQLSTTDGLTGLSVRRYFDVMSARAFKTAKAFRLPLSIVLIDIDHFKKINDTYGHQAGDEVLRKVAGIIKKGIRFHAGKAGGDIVARYGGEEFILLLPNTDLKAAAFNVADRIRKGIEAIPIEWENTQISVTVSMGVAARHDFDEKPENIVRRADEALYRSKEGGRNRTSIESFSV